MVLVPPQRETSDFLLTQTEVETCPQAIAR